MIGTAVGVTAFSQDVDTTDSVSYSLDDDQDTALKSHVVIGWLLGRSDDVSEMLKTHLLSGVLLDNSASPLRKFLETTDLGSAPSELCGMDDSTQEATFQCGLEGTDPKHAQAIEEAVLGVLAEFGSAVHAARAAVERWHGFT